METRISRAQWLMISGLIWLILHLTGCSKEKEFRVYHPFPENIWERFDALEVEIPVDSSAGSWNLIINIWFAGNFEPDELPLYVILEHPSGEERISEYLIEVKDRHGMVILPCEGDSCVGKCIIQRDFRNIKKGNISLKIENLNPKMMTQGIAGVEVILEPAGE